MNGEQKKFLDENGLKILWNQISMHDYPNNAALTSVINAIDANKADKTDIPRIDTTLSAAGAAADAKAVGQAIENIELTPGPKGDSGVYVGISAPTDESVNVWIDPNGEPINIPTGGGGGSQNFSVVLTSDAAYRIITVPLPVNLGKALIFNVHITFPSVQTEFVLAAVSGRCYFGWGVEKIPVNGKEVGANLYAIRHTENIYNSGTTVAKDYTYSATPKLGTAGWLVRSYMDNTLSIYSNTDGVDLPAGTKIEVWGICE